MDLNQNGILDSAFNETDDTNINELSENIDSSDIVSLVFEKSVLESECDVLENNDSESEKFIQLSDSGICSEDTNPDLISNNEISNEVGSIGLLSVSYDQNCEDVPLEINKCEDNIEEVIISDAQQALQLWKCPKCSSLFCDKSACFQHCEDAHNFVCGLCREPCDDKSNLERHIIEHIASGPSEELQKVDKDALIDACTQTDLTFNVQNAALHKDLQPLQVTFVPPVNSISETQIETDDDIEYFTEKKDPPNKCEVCDSRFFSESALVLHMKSKHEDAPMKDFHKCDTCGMLFQWKLYLTRHKASKHGNENDFSFRCEICNKLFSSQENLDNHKKLHIEVFSFTCDFCEQKFGGSAEHLQHIKTAHPYSREFPCPICDRSFKSKTFLNAHSVEVHPDRCQICEKFYKSPRALEEHMLIEHGCERKKYFTCEYCGKLFSKNGIMLQHVKMYHKSSFIS